MKKNCFALALIASLVCSAPAFAAQSPTASSSPNAIADAQNQQDDSLVQRLSTPMSSTTTGTVTVEGKSISYKAVAGTLVINGTGAKESTPEVAMSYVAYFKQGVKPGTRPVTFFYNGGPGSSTVWLLMGGYGPKRVVTGDNSHTPAAPYQVVNNDYSLLDASDLVFIDMPGTGFGRLLPQGKDEAARAKDRTALEKEIWGVDGDAQAFSRFITQFLSKYDRWNSPKYLYGESYGTTRSAVLAGILELQDNIDINGVILQSQILNFNLSIDGTHADAGIDLPYVLALPAFAATAWYHDKLPKFSNGKLGPLLTQATQFARTDYLQALLAGSTLSPATRQAVAEKLHDYTGLPVAYLVKADLRVSGSMFEHELLTDSDTSTGRLDSRFSGASMDPMAENSSYDPQSAAISSAYISAFNSYVRDDLQFGQDLTFRPMVYGLKGFHWDMKHRAPDSDHARQGSLNVMGDLAAAMKYNPALKVMMNGGFYDLATPYSTAVYELQHLAIPAALDKNISYAFYPSGHMIYVNIPSLQRMHDNVARFIESTDNQSAPDHSNNHPNS